MILHTTQPTFEDLKLDKLTIRFFKLAIKDGFDSDKDESMLTINEKEWHPIIENKNIVLAKLQKLYPNLILIDHTYYNIDQLTYIEDDYTNRDEFYLNFAGNYRQKIKENDLNKIMPQLNKILNLITFYHEVKTLTGSKDQVVFMNLKKLRTSLNFLPKNEEPDEYTQLFFYGDIKPLNIANKGNERIENSFYKALNNYHKKQVILNNL